MTREQTTLKKALELLGSKKALCRALWLSYEELEDYLAGNKAVPQWVGSAAAKIVKESKQ